MHGTGFALVVNSSAYPPLSLSVARLHSFQVLSPGPTSTQDCESGPCFGVGYKSLFEDLNQACLHTTEFPVRECSPLPNFVLQVSKTFDWDYYLGPAGMNSISQYPCAHCCKHLSPALSQSDSQ